MYKEILYFSLRSKLISQQYSYKTVFLILLVCFLSLWSKESGVLYSWRRIPAALVARSHSVFSPTHLIPHCTLNASVGCDNEGCKRNPVIWEQVFYKAKCIQLIMQPLKVVFALLYFVTFWTKVIQKEVEEGEGASAMMSIQPEELYVKELCLHTVVANPSHHITPMSKFSAPSRGRF